jgi:hypothetical protein
MNKTANKIRQKSSKNDIYYTPLPVAKKMIDMCNITSEMKVLDPCFGAGVFYDNLPECKKEWCEIEKGKDFFDETEKYDLIIGNPPYSLWDKWLDKTMELTDKFCYIFGTLNLTTLRLNKILNKGYAITHFHLLNIDWWFSQSFLVVFEKNKSSIISVEPKVVHCEKCNKRCGRGRNGNDVNTCLFINK